MQYHRTHDGTGSADRIAATFSDTRTDRPALTMNGTGASLTVHRGQLVLRDGIGPYRRERRLSRVDRTVRRIVMLCRDGYLTLEAVRWCATAGITVMQVERDGSVIALAGAPATEDARVRRGQVLSGTSDVAAEITRTLLACKLNGQADTAEHVFRNVAAATTIRATAQNLSRLHTIDSLRSAEGSAASHYWQSWIGSTPYWAPDDLQKIPPHWCMFAARPSLRSAHRSNRGATDPVNAALNYCYALAEAECVTLLREYGIDPTMGVLHCDREGRYSLAIDLLETMRPTVDRTVLNALSFDHRSWEPHVSIRWFKEARDGTVRLTPPLTNRLAEHVVAWSAVARPYAEYMAQAFAGITTAAPIIPYVSPTNGQTNNVAERSVTPADVLSAMNGEFWPAVATILRERVARTKSGRPRPDNDQAVLTAVLCQMNGHTIPPTLNVTRHVTRHRVLAWKRDGVWDDVERVAIEHQLISA